MSFEATASESMALMLYRQITLDETILDAAKSSIVFAVASRVSTPGSAVRKTNSVENWRN